MITFEEGVIPTGGIENVRKIKWKNRTKAFTYKSRTIHITHKLHLHNFIQRKSCLITGDQRREPGFLLVSEVQFFLPKKRTEFKNPLAKKSRLFGCRIEVHLGLPFLRTPMQSHLQYFDIWYSIWFIVVTAQLSGR